MPFKISVVIPACDAEHHLKHSLEALRQTFDRDDAEIILVDDGSRDGTAELGRSYGLHVLNTGRRMGPAFARNKGGSVASGDILFFIDADVCVKPETFRRIRENFLKDPDLDALIGSYDTTPHAPDFLSQYRNLMHCFVHQKGVTQASTFWSGCGAVRRDVFLEHSGFSESYRRPAIEDIELGYRLVRANRKIMLDRELMVKHLKRWTFWGLLKTDILDRGIPWTELILSERNMPNDLNLQLSQRISVALVFLLIALGAATAWMSKASLLIPPLLVVFLMLARWWGELGRYRRPRRAMAILSGVLTVVTLVAYDSKMYGIIPFLAAMPTLLLLRHRYDKIGRLSKWHRMSSMAFICTSIAVAAIYLPTHPLISTCFAVLLLLAVLNSQFYLFLAGQRGVSFMLAAIPFHLLYHFYSGVSFLIGCIKHCGKVWRKTKLLSPTSS
jgi:GT2 family glycosyltransferase